MNDKKYDSYEEAMQRETVKKIAKENEELDKRMKLEESLNVLATFKIIGIILAIIAGVLILTGVISLGAMFS